LTADFRGCLAKIAQCLTILSSWPPISAVDRPRSRTSRALAGPAAWI